MKVSQLKIEFLGILPHINKWSKHLTIPQLEYNFPNCYSHLNNLQHCRRWAKIKRLWGEQQNKK